MQTQTDERIGVEDLGYAFFNNKKYVVNRRPGVPRNALIEEFDGQLRCWASKVWLTEEAAKIVRTNATYQPDNNSFIWNRQSSSVAQR